MDQTRLVKNLDDDKPQTDAEDLLGLFWTDLNDFRPLHPSLHPRTKHIYPRINLSTNNLLPNPRIQKMCQQSSNHLNWNELDSGLTTTECTIILEA